MSKASTKHTSSASLDDHANSHQQTIAIAALFFLFFFSFFFFPFLFFSFLLFREKERGREGEREREKKSQVSGVVHHYAASSRGFRDDSTKCE